MLSNNCDGGFCSSADFQCSESSDCDTLPCYNNYCEMYPCTLTAKIIQTVTLGIAQINYASKTLSAIVVLMIIFAQVTIVILPRTYV